MYKWSSLGRKINDNRLADVHFAGVSTPILSVNFYFSFFSIFRSITNAKNFSPADHPTEQERKSMGTLPNTIS
jgi:hypothetical protein